MLGGVLTEKTQYWAYLDKNGTVHVKKWQHGNNFLEDAHSSDDVARFLLKPFNASSFAEAQKEAENLLSQF